MFAEAAPPAQIDFLVIGHICRDRVADGRVVGGAAAYTASIARALGCRPAIVTSSSPAEEWADDLPDIPIHNVLAPATTEFENVYTPAGRVQTIHSVAGRLGANSVPPLWTRTPMVYLGPIANEVEPEVIHLFSNSVVGVGPQGWMRSWDERGRVSPTPWPAAAEVLPLAAVTILSREDLPAPETLATFARLAKILVVTQGAEGCTVYFHGEERAFPAPRVSVTDTTGAGDIFAAAYLIRLFQTDGNVWEAAMFANRIAACSVTRSGLQAKTQAVQRILGEDARQTTDGAKAT
jgi:hypothetical protein